MLVQSSLPAVNLRNQVDGVVVTFWKCLDLISDGTRTILSIFMVLYSPSKQMAGQYHSLQNPCQLIIHQSSHDQSYIVYSHTVKQTAKKGRLREYTGFTACQ
jgi:hypothetical protein